MRVIVRAPNWVGDCVLATPFLRLLRERHPSSRIDVLARPPGHEVFVGNPFVDEVIVYTEMLGTAAHLRARRYDLGYLLPNSFSSAFLFFLARVRERIGYDAEARGILLTRRFPWKGETEHRTVRYLRLLDPHREPASVTPRSCPAQIFLDPHAEAHAPSRRWPAQRYGRLAKLLVETVDAEVVLVGGKAAADREAVEVALRECRSPRVHDLGGKTTLRGFAAVVRRAKVLVTGDTGIMHVAAAVGTPILALEGAADVKVTAPWTPGVFEVIDKHVHCSPCVRNVCINRESPMLCMDSIAVEEVFSTLRQMLRARA